MLEQLSTKEQTANNKSHASDTHVSYKYKPTLIPSLLNEHQTLLSLCRDTIESAVKGNADLSKENLSKFYDVFSGHLIKKRYALYSCSSHLINDEVALEKVNSMTSEMYRIGKDLHVLSSLYAKGQREINRAFIEKFEVLGQALAKQLKNEESHLFPVYQAACLADA